MTYSRNTTMVPWYFKAVQFLFLFIFCGGILAFTYYSGIFIVDWNTEQLSKQGLVIPSYSYPGAMVGLLFFWCVFWGIPLSILFERLFPVVNSLSTLELEKRSAHHGTYSNSFWYLLGMLTKQMASHRSPNKEFLDTVYSEPRLKKGQQIENKDIESALKSGQVARRISLIFLAITGLLSSLFIYGHLQGYVLISDKGIERSQMFTGQKQSYEWNQITKMSFGIESKIIDGEYDHNPKLIVHTKLDEIPVWVAFDNYNPPVEKIQELVWYFEKNDIPLDLSGLSYNVFISEHNSGRPAVEYLKSIKYKSIK